MPIQNGTYRFSNNVETLTITNANERTGTANGIITVAAYNIPVEMWYHDGNGATTLAFSGGTGGLNSVHVGGTIRKVNNTMQTIFSLSTDQGIKPYNGDWRHV